MANNNHFKLTLDTLAPSGSISAERYYNANGVVNIVKGDATQMSVWFDSKENGDRADASEFITATDKVDTTFSADGNYYYHVVLRDDVGNESEVYNTSVITYDITKPEVTSVSINNGDAYTNNPEVTVDVEFADALSGVVSIQLSGDIATQPVHTLTPEEALAGKVTLSATLNTLTTEDGQEGANRVVKAVVTDAAGNTSVESSDSISFDTVVPEGALYLRDADNESNLPEYVNSTAFTAQIDINDDHSDIVGYKIWGDFSTTDNISTGTTKPATFTTVEAGTDPINLSLYFTSSDGKKTVNVEIIDRASNITILESKSVNLIQTAAEVSITSDVSYVSAVDGFNVATITTKVTASTDVKSWVLMNGDNTLKSGTGAVPETIAVSSADLGEEGAKSLTLVVTDIAGNSATSTAVVVTVDKTGPVASDIAVNAWYKASAGFVASATDDGAGMKYMQAWVSTTANDEVAKGEQLDYVATTAGDTSKFDWTGVEQGDNYVHIKYTDAVGNVTIAHSAKFGFDNVAPEAGSISIPKYTNSPSINATISYNDATSGVQQMKVWGDITSAATENEASWVDVATSYAITLTAGDGNKTVNVKFRDVAGNESVTPYASATGELDQTAPGATLALRTADDSAAQPGYTPVAQFAAHVSGGDDALTGTATEYLLYGDFSYDSQSAQGVTETSAVWQALTYEEGQQYMVVKNMFATSDDGTKNIYLKVKDNAGNVSAVAQQAFVYDTTAPSVIVSGVDYNRISKMHTARTDNASKFNDETNFVFTPDAAIQAYKVCAYADQASAEEGSHNDPAIPTSAGSVNMVATGLSSAEAVSAMIRGADLEAASAGDGVKIVVVYVQDLAGTWSVAAEFAV